MSDKNKNLLFSVAAFTVLLVMIFAVLLNKTSQDEIVLVAKERDAMATFYRTSIQPYWEDYIELVDFSDASDIRVTAIKKRVSEGLLNEFQAFSIKGQSNEFRIWYYHHLGKLQLLEAHTYKETHGLITALGTFGQALTLANVEQSHERNTQDKEYIKKHSIVTNIKRDIMWTNALMAFFTTGQTSAKYKKEALRYKEAIYGNCAGLLQLNVLNAVVLYQLDCEEEAKALMAMGKKKHTNKPS